VELDQLFGLPAHPLLVHMPVVIIPLTLLLAIAAVAWRRGRSVLSLVVAGAATVGMLGAQLAVMSGEPLEERVAENSLIEQHAELGEGARTFAILVFLIAVAYVVREWRGRIPLPGVDRVRALVAPRAIGIALAVALIASSALTTVWVVRAGHAGADATWSDLPAVSQGVHGEDGDE
jgi:uncharacterized membrane protein